MATRHPSVFRGGLPELFLKSAVTLGFSTPERQIQVLGTDEGHVHVEDPYGRRS